MTITKFSATPTGFLTSRTKDHSISAFCDDHGGRGGGSNDDHGGDHSGRGGPSRCLNITASVTSASSCAASDTACSSCGLAYATIDACDNFRPRLPQLGLHIPGSIAALCLCYNGVGDNSSAVTWVPNQFDAPYSFCPQWASTADSAHVRDYSTGVNYCSSVGNILNATLTNLASTTSASGGTTAGSGGSITGSATTAGGSGSPTPSQLGSNVAAGGFDAKVSGSKSAVIGDVLTGERDRQFSPAFASRWHSFSSCDLCSVASFSRRLGVGQHNISQISNCVVLCILSESRVTPD